MGLDSISASRVAAFISGVTGSAGIVGFGMSCLAAAAQTTDLAPEGRGLLAQPTETVRDLGGVPPPHVFAPDPSGAFSRTIFETDEDPDFRIIVREYSFPPDKQKHTVILSSGAFARLVSGPGEMTIANNRLDLSSIARASLAANTPIEVTNNGEQPIVVRVLIMEAK